MIRAKISIILSALMLTLASSIVNKLNSKCLCVIKLYYLNGVSCVYITQLSYSIAFTTGGSGVQASIRTANGGKIALFGTAACHSTHAVHLHV